MAMSYSATDDWYAKISRAIKLHNEEAKSLKTPKLKAIEHDT